MRFPCLVLASGLATATVASAALPQDGEGSRLLVGRWTWTRADVACTEVYDYRADGTYSALSGAEKTESRYTIAAKPNAQGFYRLDAEVVKDYGGQDCAQSSSDDTGLRFTNYLFFAPSGRQYWACYSESKDDCFGPLNRVDADKKK
jgi:hypothetical protein